VKVGPATESWSVVEVDEKFHGGVGDGLKVEGTAGRCVGHVLASLIFWRELFFRSSETVLLSAVAFFG